MTNQAHEITVQIVCSCGKGCTGKDAHEIAHRTTIDGKTVVLWSDGALTGAMGMNMLVYPGKTVRGIADKVAKGRKLLEWCSIETWDELRQEVKGETCHV